MATFITIRNVPPDHHAAIVKRAKLHKRSLNSELLMMIEEHAVESLAGLQDDERCNQRAIKCSYPGHGYHSGECPKAAAKSRKTKR